MCVLVVCSFLGSHVSEQNTPAGIVTSQDLPRFLLAKVRFSLPFEVWVGYFGLYPNLSVPLNLGPI